MKKPPALLVLEDGTVYKGWSLNNLYTITGEVVFTTGITGYQEILTDPSYLKQIVVFTYPEIGNTGINNEDNESKQIRCAGIITRNICNFPSNWRTQASLDTCLQKENIPLIYGLDTRKLTRHLRAFGSMRGCISNENLSPKALLSQINQTPPMSGLDLVSQVTTPSIYKWDKISNNKWNFQGIHYSRSQFKKSVVVIDYGVKYNILRRLTYFGLESIVLPATATAEEILSYKPSGIMLSNGPGDPAAVSYAVETLKNLIDTKIPIFGICMGHQLLSLALGAKTFKLKFGHRGINHPTGVFQKVEITSQNHGFAVDALFASYKDIKITHYNLNDWTIAGIVHKKLPIFSVQYHPEASPGPHDADFLFDTFAQVVLKSNSV